MVFIYKYTLGFIDGDVPSRCIEMYLPNIKLGSVILNTAHFTDLIINPGKAVIGSSSIQNKNLLLWDQLNQSEKSLFC